MNKHASCARACVCVGMCIFVFISVYVTAGSCWSLFDVSVAKSASIVYHLARPYPRHVRRDIGTIAINQLVLSSAV